LIGQPAGADDALLKAPLVACASDKTVIGGVNACGKIWKIGSGEVTLNADGKLTVSIQGLVLNDPSVGKYDGSPDGVDMVAVAVVCRGKRGLVVAQTEQRLSAGMAMFESVRQFRSRRRVRPPSF
jgi:hypothetical protein